MLEQETELYRYSLDPFLLFNFFRDDFRPKKDKRYRFADFCSGTGIIAFLLSREYPAIEIEGIEIQKELYESALANLKREPLPNLAFQNRDLKEFKDFLKPNSCDAVLSNPPYRKLAKGRLNRNPSHLVANHEVSLTLRQLLEAARYALKPLGAFYCSYHPSRYDELMAEMIHFGLKPMAIKNVHPDKNSEAAIVLVKAVFKGKNESSILPPLFLDEVSKETYR